MTTTLLLRNCLMLLAVITTAIILPLGSVSPDPNPPGIRTNTVDQSAQLGSGIDQAFPHNPSADPDLEPGFPVQTVSYPGTYMGWTAYSTRVGNIDSDPQLEILVSATAQGPLYAWKSDGALAPGWPFYYYNRVHYTSLGNLSNQADGLEVVTSQWVEQIPEYPPGPLHVLTGSGDFLPGWPKDSEFNIDAPPSLADVNSDGLDEIFVWEGRSLIHAYQADGASIPGWPVPGEEATHSIADLDGDGDLELVTIINNTSTGADLVAYHHDGTRYANLSIFVHPYRHPLPVIGDVDGDGSQEIIILADDPGEQFLSLYIFSNEGQLKHRSQIEMFAHGSTMEASSAPALADLDQDHIPEIVIGFNEGIIVYKGDGTIMPGWPVTWYYPQFLLVGWSAPVVGDIDGDQYPDVVSISIFRCDEPGYVFAYDRHGKLIAGFPKYPRIGMGAVPAIADIDLDGRNELIITGDYWDGYIGDYDRVWVYDLHGNNYGDIEWGQLGGGPQNWGSYPPPPIYSGVNIYVSSPHPIFTQPTDILEIPVSYGNRGVQFATSTSLTITLDPALTYFSDTSGAIPSIDGQTLVWQLPDQGYSIHKNFLLTVGLPPNVTYGDTYSLQFKYSSAQVDARQGDNTLSTIIQVTKQIYLPEIKR